MKNKSYLLFLLMLIVIPIAHSQNRPPLITFYKNDSGSEKGFHKSPDDFFITVIPEKRALEQGQFNLTGWWYGTNLMDWLNEYMDELTVDTFGSVHNIKNYTTQYLGRKPRKDWELYVEQNGNTLFGESELIKLEGTVDGNTVTFKGTWKFGRTINDPPCVYVDSDEIEEYEGTLTEQDDYYVYVIRGSFSGWRNFYDECHYVDPSYWYDYYKTKTLTWEGPFAIGVNPLVVDFVDAEDYLRKVIGAAADGESKVIIRIRGLPPEVRYPSQVVVLVGMESGELLDDAWIAGDTYTQTWQAPEDFGGGNPPQGRREIYFYITIDGKGVDVPRFYLYKPPLLLVHGIWSDAFTWKTAIPYFIENYFGGNEKLIYAESYPNSRHFSQNYPLIRTFIRRLVKYAEKCATSPKCDGAEIVVKQVDIIAHSMGGILSNLYANLDIYQDDINKLITFGTPHSGSEFANFALYFIFKEMPQNLRDTWIILLEIIGKSIIEGAAEDLQVGSPVISEYSCLSMRDIPVYAIKVQHLGKPGWLINPVYEFLWSWDHFLNKNTTYFEDADAEDHYSLYNPLKVEKGMFGKQYYSDFIVSLTSQQGGSSVAGITNAIDHVHQTENTEVLSMALSGLNAPVENLDTNGFSPPTDYPIPPVNVTDIPEVGIVKDTIPLASSSFSITSPTNGSLFNPGENVTVEVAYNGSTERIFFIAEDNSYGSDNSSPYIFKFQINPEYIGLMRIAAWVFKEDGSFNHDIIEVNVFTTEKPDNITTLPSSPLYLYSGDEVILYVEGLYGNISRDIASHLTGTTYKSSNITVVTVSEDGVVHANIPGHAVIEITNGIKVNLEIIVSDDCIVPRDEMIIRKAVKFCPGTYFLPYGFEIDINNVEIDCNGAIIKGNYSGDGILINKQRGVKLKNCTLQNYKKAILINNSYETSIISNNLYLNDFAVYIYNSDKNTISNSNIFNNGYHGIFTEYSSEVSILSNNIYNNGLSNDLGYGIYCRYASNANITNNKITDHAAPNYAYGIKLKEFPNVVIQNNVFFRNKDNAIQVESSDNASIKQNTLERNIGGIHIELSNNSKVYHNNMLNNTIQGYDNGNNYWDNGVKEGGNYWGNYDTEAEGCYDIDGNGYCDLPYSVSPKGKDNYPFKKENGWLKVTFSTNLKKGWNLISIPLNLTNNTLPSPFKSIEGNYSKIFTYNNKWIELRDGSKINETMGLWINMLNNDTLNLEGNEIKDSTFNLINGWNLVGYPYLEHKSVSDIFKNASVYSYNGSWSSYVPDRVFNSLQTLKPGYGYWVKK